MLPLGWIRGADSYVWPKWLLIYAISTLPLFVPRFNRGLMLPGTRLVPLGALTLLGYFAVMLFHIPGAYENHFIDALAFSSIAVLSGKAFASESGAWKNTVRFALLGGVAALAGSIGQILFTASGSLPGSTFGHPNFAGECYGFLGLLATEQAFLEPRKRNRTVYALLAVSFAIFLFFLKSRGALLSLTAGLLTLFFFSSIPRNKITIGVVGGAIISLLLCLVLNPQLLTSGDRKLEEEKIGNLWVRKVRWHNTLHMIEDKPLGIGPGNFEFGYLPYANSWSRDGEAHDGIIIRSPHNGYLESLAENGIPFTLLLLGALGSLLACIVAKRPGSGRTERAICLSGFAYFLTDALVAFPMETPYPFFAMAVLTGLALTMVSDGRVRRVHPALKGIVACLLLLGTALFSFSKAVEADYIQSRSAVSAACTLFPSNWRVCLKYAKSELEEKRYPEGKAALERMLRFQPHNYQALRLLSFAHFRMGAKEEGCATLKHYNSLFFGGSSLKNSAFKLCGEQ